ncbi:MAG: hypothetical protein LBI26_01615 [Holosporales bacterium]|jgi:hypothetical protein|nr:hypothetical protein [Holosporales bacterium]
MLKGFSDKEESILANVVIIRGGIVVARGIAKNRPSTGINTIAKTRNVTLNFRKLNENS